MEQAIKKAIEGGWEPKQVWDKCDSYLLDPFFWQALGKAEGWAKKPVYSWTYEFDNSKLTQRWRVEWFNFIDHLAEGKHMDSFFKDLLTKD